MSKLKIALIGAGRIGRVHAANLALLENAQLTVVSDAIEAAAIDLAGRYGVRATTDAAAAIASPDVDAVLVCSSTDTHAEMILAAVRAGKPVFCEKPVDMSADGIRAVLAGVAAAKGMLMVGFNRRFDPNFREVQNRIANGAIGNVELVSIISKDPAPPPVSYIARSGGLFRDMMIHDFDMARFLLGEEPVEVHAVGSSLVDPAIGEAGDVDTAAVLLRTASGKIATITNSRRATFGYDQRIEVHGAVGMLSVGNQHVTTVSEANTRGYTADVAQLFFLERYNEAYRAELAAFIDCATTGKAPSPAGEDGLRAQMLADAATESVRTGLPVRLTA
ncbi:inositol 2-dehydrogenase [Acidocella aquatica]|uniref:Inositol 2-dehydrogenase n=1 Tax=Acidocella aquatica TaxID=1922313 RepID=A0ABQ6A661_9PROT|nr:inositol 2-dehydrogenase [Acidocella aquatica]GLR67133.1 inositol 2-dehydrogenase [Acidocella aquatica]